MERIFDMEMIRKLEEKSGIKDYFATSDIEKYIIKYQAGEYLTSLTDKIRQIQFVVEGTVSIYCIRQDGSLYALAQGSEQYILGELELLGQGNNTIYAQSVTDVTCIAISIEEYKAQLLQDVVFMREIAKRLAVKMEMIIHLEVIPSSLEDRVLNYMNCFCKGKQFTGLEKTSFRLHCSARQLQRVLNKLEHRNMVEKIGKGSYQLKGN